MKNIFKIIGWIILVTVLLVLGWGIVFQAMKGTVVAYHYQPCSMNQVVGHF